MEPAPTNSRSPGAQVLVAPTEADAMAPRASETLTMAAIRGVSAELFWGGRCLQRFSGVFKTTNTTTGAVWPPLFSSAHVRYVCCRAQDCVLFFNFTAVHGDGDLRQRRALNVAAISRTPSTVQAPVINASCCVCIASSIPPSCYTSLVRSLMAVFLACSSISATTARKFEAAESPLDGRCPPCCHCCCCSHFHLHHTRWHARASNIQYRGSKLAGRDNQTRQRTLSLFPRATSQWKHTSGL